MEGNENKMTIREAVECTIRDLGAIPVPIGLIDVVAIPIATAIQNLKNICAAWDAEEAKKNGNSLADDINEAIQEAVRMEEVNDEHEGDAGK